MADREMGAATRDAFGKTLAQLGDTEPDIVVLDGDLSKSTMTKYFAEKHPDRFFNAGIAEGNMVGMAAGLASAGKKPWIASFATFVMSKGFDQLRVAVAYSELRVVVVGSHGGISIGEDGVSQMGHEDVALACSLPGFTVVVPADETSTVQATRALAAHDGPAFLRTGRPKVPNVYPDGCDFALGIANTLRDGSDVTLIANGLMVSLALDAADALSADGISARVLDMHTAKPLDDEAVAKAATETGAIVVAEEHLLRGGLGSAVAMSVAKQHPVPMRFVGIDDTYAESGIGTDVLKKYGLTSSDITQTAKELVG